MNSSDHGDPDFYFISVIVPVRNESRHIGQVLDRLLRQRYDPDLFEILVVDGRSEDDTREKVQRYCENHKQIRLLDNPLRLSSGARNVGIRAARGEIVLLVDGHCIIDSQEMFSKTNEAFHFPQVDCLGRPQPLELDHATPMQLAIAAARRSRIGHHPDSLIYENRACFSPAISVAVAYRKTVFDQVGLFDERFDAAEDCELNHRIDKAGLKCYFAPDIAVRYVPRRSISALAKQLVRYGRGRVRLTRKHPETFSWKGFVPAAFVTGILTGSVLCMIWLFMVFQMFSPPGGLSAACSVFLGVMLVYFGVVVSESVRIALRERRLGDCVRLPLVFMTIHVAFGWGLLYETLFPGRGFRKKNRHDDHSCFRGDSRL